VNKVAGNFHIAAGRSYQRGSMHVHDMAPFGDKALDFSHKVHHMSFGATYPGECMLVREGPSLLALASNTPAPVYQQLQGMPVLASAIEAPFGLCWLLKLPMCSLCCGAPPQA
jgi:hypothetical protein